MTDSCCDLKHEYVLENNIFLMKLMVTIGDNEIEDDLGQTLDYKEFYKQIRNGEMPKTAQVNAYTFEEEFEKLVKEGKEIIYIAFSSALSWTYNSACIAKGFIEEKYPEDQEVAYIISAALKETMIVGFDNSGNSLSEEDFVEI